MTWNSGALVVHAGATLALTGLIWFVQVVHYPLLARVGAAGYAAAHRQLVVTNWLRTLAWTARGVLVLVMLSGARPG